MRAISIEFRGYQRLVETSCNTDGKIIAFLGPNEAGKTTLLRALDWFSHGDGGLPEAAKNKVTPPDNNTPVVAVKYWIEPSDVEALEDLRLLEAPRYFHSSRFVNGETRSHIDPEIQRDAAPFATAVEQLDLVEDKFSDDFARDAAEADEDRPATISSYIQAVRAAVSSPETAGWNRNWDEGVDGLIEYLREPIQDEGGLPRASHAADAIELVKRIRSAGELHVAVTRILSSRVPEFTMFTAEDRDLRSAYDLSIEETQIRPPRALDNLAWVADLRIGALWTAIEAGDVRAARTMERRANEQLKAKLGPRWSQEELNVQFNVDGNNLEVLINESARDGADTPIDERSDGLRSFVALVAFLARHDFAQPPILLVDEAETHLHYDAQADLVEVLTSDVQATQVFYTTHSPGCLPRDLGTGIRLVSPRRDRSDASALRNDFWARDEPGFTPLLFAMGAGAAAFSAFRRAVLAEGASDMILLPSLIRLATGLRELDFQVAPGLANYNGTGFELEETAARVIYLVDGDTGGDEKRRALVESMGISESRVKQYPKGMALEDCVHPELYLSTINGLLRNPGPETVIELDSLDRSVPISKAIESWCRTRGAKAPGKPAVAAQLVSKPAELRLAESAEDVLMELHRQISEGFSLANH